MQFENFKEKNDNFILNIFLVIQALKFYRYQRKKNDIDFQEKPFHYLYFDNP